MQLVNFNYKAGDNFVTAKFVGNITKLKTTESLELSFERLGGEYLPELSGKESVWKFPAFINSQTIQQVIKNTCFECGGLMTDSTAFQNTSVDDFGNDAGNRGTTQSRLGQAKQIIVRKCTECGHSHT